MIQDILTLIRDAAWVMIVFAAALAMLACAIESMRMRISDVAFNVYMLIRENKQLEENDDENS